MKNLSLLLLLAFNLSAHAYHVDEHRVITRQAFKELTACFPKAKPLLSIELIVNGDADEDLDVFTKWLFYSHYYNPNKKLDMRRADSADRVSTLSSTLRTPKNARPNLLEMSDLGHMIHHLQDSTVPAHVVPVDHSLWDGFERYKSGDFTSGLTCDEITALAASDALTILKDTALSTLSNISGSQYGPGFWVESKSNAFGSYGYLGNNFGEVDFDNDGVSYHIDDSVYVAFKTAQLQLATQATIRGLMWELGGDLKKTNDLCLPEAFE
jgi:hypothetical protein